MNNTHDEHERDWVDESTNHDSDSKSFISQLPTLKEFVFDEWKDIAAMGVVYGLVNAVPGVVGNRLFPIPFVPSNSTFSSPYFSDYTSQYDQVPDARSLLSNSYPFRSQIIPVWLSALLALLPPIVLFALFQLKLKSYPDLHASVYGLLTTLVHGTVFQSALKSFIGGLRPYFYDACRPDPAKLLDENGALKGTGFGGVMFDLSVCTGEWADLRKAITGWPSGHSNAAMGSAVFVSLYLNAKLKVWADRRARYWKMFALLFPILIGLTLATSLNLDQSHTWYDILTGMLIGTMCAFTSWRMRYAAIFDWRFNHIPLPPSPSRAPSSTEKTESNKQVWKRRLGMRKSRVEPQRFRYILPTALDTAHQPVLSRYWVHDSVQGAAGDALVVPPDASTRV